MVRGTDWRLHEIPTSGRSRSKDLAAVLRGRETSFLSVASSPRVRGREDALLTRLQNNPECRQFWSRSSVITPSAIDATAEFAALCVNSSNVDNRVSSFIRYNFYEIS